MTLLKQVKNKYNTLYARVAKALQTGKFATYTAAQQQAVYNRLRRYENRLKHFGVAVTSAAALFFLPTKAAGQVIRTGNEFQVNTYTANNQNYASVAKNNSGKFIVAWQSDGQDGDGFGVYAKRYDENGVAQGSEFLVNTTTTHFQGAAAVAMDNDGDFVIAWASQQQDGNSSDIYAQRYNNNGIAQGTEFLVNTYTAGNQPLPLIAMDADGDFVIVWADSGQQTGGFYDIYAQRYNNSGVAQGSEFLVNTYTINNQFNASVAMDNDGDFVIAWQSDLQDGNNFGIYAQRYNNNGVAEGSEFQVNTFTAYGESDPSVAMDIDGDFVIAWTSRDQYGIFYGIYAQRYDSNGTAQGSEFLVNTTTTTAQDYASVGMDSNGDFVITWQIFQQDGNSYGIYAQEYNSNGVKQGSEFLVNTTTANQQYFSSIAMDGYGDFVVTWHSYLQDGSGYGVYAQRYAKPLSATPDLTAATKILLYPNPVSEVVVIENAVGTATVFNALGQVLQEFIITDTKHFFNTNGLTSGVYTLQIRDANGTVAVKQFIK